jgi:hypothetical protein
MRIAKTTETCEMNESAAPIPSPSMVEWITRAIQKVFKEEEGEDLEGEWLWLWL